MPVVLTILAFALRGAGAAGNTPAGKLLCWLLNAFTHVYVAVNVQGLQAGCVQRLNVEPVSTATQIQMIALKMKPQLIAALLRCIDSLRDET
jgi:hypothetical protein